MIKEAIEHVEQHTLENARPQLVRRDDDPNHLWEIRSGCNAWCHPIQRRRDVRIHSVMDVATFAQNMGFVIFTSGDKISVVEPMTGRLVAYMPLTFHRHFTWLLEYAKPKAITIQQLIADLTFTLRTAAPEGLRVFVSAVSFTTQQAASIIAQRGKESLGASITNEVGEAMKLPAPQQGFILRIWNEVAAIAQEAVVIIEPDPGKQQWVLMADDAPEEILTRSVMSLRNHVAAECGEDATVYTGDHELTNQIESYGPTNFGEQHQLAGCCTWPRAGRRVVC